MCIERAAALQLYPKARVRGPMTHQKKFSVSAGAISMRTTHALFVTSWAHGDEWMASLGAFLPPMLRLSVGCDPAQNPPPDREYLKQAPRVA